MRGDEWGDGGQWGDGRVCSEGVGGDYREEKVRMKHECEVV